MAERILDVKNLKINFHTYAGDVKAIRDVSFHLNKGETLAIVGESGSGKSVTTKSIMGLLASNAEVVGGSIMFQGQLTGCNAFSRSFMFLIVFIFCLLFLYKFFVIELVLVAMKCGFYVGGFVE